MKRMLMAATASLTLVFAAPGVALAHQGKHHRGARHATGHHGKRAHLVTFGGPGTSSATSGTSSTPATSPTEESAGTVTSFSGGVLTITLSDKKTVVSGKVDEGTELTCRAPASATGGDDQGGGDDQDSSDGAGHGDSSGAQPMSQQHDDFQGDEHRGDGWDENEQEGQEGCTTALLVPGAVVRTAELRMSGAGSVWEKVELVH